MREAESAEIILAHSHYSVRSLALLRRIGVLRSPLVAFVHSLHSRAVDRIWLSGFDALLPFTVEAVEQLRAMRLPSRIVYMPFGADLHFYREPVAGELRDLVLSVGVSGRDFRTLISAAPLIGAPVHVVGRISSSDADAAAASLTLHSTGNYDLPFAELAKLYSRALCVVVATHGTNHPYGNNGVVEAMAHGRPVVLTRGSGIDIDPEALGFGTSIPPHDARALAEAVNRIIADPQLVHTLGVEARAQAESTYNTEVMARVLVDVLGSI